MDVSVFGEGSGFQRPDIFASTKPQKQNIQTLEYDNKKFETKIEPPSRDIFPEKFEPEPIEIPEIEASGTPYQQIQ